MDTAWDLLSGLRSIGWLILSSGPAMFRRDGYRRRKGNVNSRGGVHRFFG
jgi:hypothetical protein